MSDALPVAVVLQTAAISLADSGVFRRDGFLSALATLLRQRKNELEHDHVRDRDALGEAGDAIVPLVDAECERVADLIEALVKRADPLGALGSPETDSTGQSVMRWRAPQGVVALSSAHGQATLALGVALAIKAGNAVWLHIDRALARSLTRWRTLFAEALKAAELDARAIVVADFDAVSQANVTPIALAIALDAAASLPGHLQAGALTVLDPQGFPLPVLVDASAAKANLLPLGQALAETGGGTIWLLHKSIAKRVLAPLIDSLQADGARLFGCKTSVKLDHRLLGFDGDWRRVPQSLRAVFRVVDDLEAGIFHLRHYAHGPQALLIAEDHDAQQRFLRQADAPGLWINHAPGEAATLAAFGPELGFARKTNGAITRLDLTRFTAERRVVVQRQE